MKRILLNERTYNKILLLIERQKGFHKKLLLIEKKLEVGNMLSQIFDFLKNKNKFVELLYNHILNTEFDDDFPVDKLMKGSSGKTLKYKEDGKDKEKKISKLLKAIGFDTSLIPKHEDDWRKFTSALGDEEFIINQAKETYNFRFAVRKGNDIGEAYKCDNYDYENVEFEPDSGGLDTSCMNDDKNERHGTPELYVKNPHFINILLMLNEDNGKIMGRAILWKTNKGVYMDRVYTLNTKLNKYFYNYAKQNGFAGTYVKDNKYFKNNEAKLFDGIDINKSTVLPYLDTFNGILFKPKRYKKWFAQNPNFIKNKISNDVLKLNDQQIFELPESIGQLSDLRDLVLHNNQLKSLPESIGKLSSLKYLGLGSNQLKSLPESIGKLSNLKYLRLGSNQLKSLPESIGQLSSLTKLTLDDNQLKSLPESIGQLSGLEVLFLDNNQLKSLPESIGQLSSLELLYLDNNQLKSLPESILNLSSLRNLELRGNPISKKDPIIQKLKNKGVTVI